MQFQVPYAHIWYGNSNTVYSERVRAVTTYPPPAAGYFLHYTQDQAQGYAHIIQLKKLWGYTTSCICYGMHTMKMHKALKFQRLYTCNYSDNLHLR